MPLLEQRRRPPRDAARRLLDRTLTRTLTFGLRWWPPVWAAVFLLGSSGGARCGGAPWPLWPLAGRAAVALPVLLAAGGPRLQAGVWAATAVAAVHWGQGEAASRSRRPAARATAAVAPAVPAAWTGALAVRVTGYPVASDPDRWRTPALVVARGAGSGPEPPGRGDGVQLRGRGPAPRPGQVVRTLCEVGPPARAATAGGFDPRRHLAGRALAWDGRALGPVLADSIADGAIAAAGRWFAERRQDLGTRLDRLLPDREARLARAVLLGWRSGPARTEAADFTTLGLAHLFAVSGLHVGILAGLLLLPATVAAVGRGARAAAVLAAVPGFVVLTGAPGSVVRAGALLVLATVGAACGRRGRGLRLLGLVFWAVTVWEPRATLDTGVRLSYLAAAGIVLANGLTGGFDPGRGRLLRAAATGLGVSLAAQWSTLPVVAGAFGRLNPWSPLANLVAVPVFGLGVWLLAAGLVLEPWLPWAAEALAAWGWLLVRALEAGAALVADPVGRCGIGLPPPGPAAVLSWLVLSGVLAAALGCRGGRGGRGAVAAACLAAGVWILGPGGRSLPPRGGPQVVQFAVGQGDCALVAFPDGWCALIDLADVWPGGDGPWTREVAPWLARQGVRRLDLVVLTHGHRDHTGGAEAAGRALVVGRWLGGGRAGDTVDTGPAPWLRPGPPLRLLHRWEDWSLTALDPGATGRAARHENDRSLAVVLWRAGTPAMFWSGDLESGGEAALLAAQLVPRGAGVWKAGHHGSDTSGSPAFLAALRPGLVLVSCGVGNRYGHPSHGPYVVAGDTVPVVRTDLQGTVTVDWPDGAARVRPLRGGPP